MSRDSMRGAVATAALALILTPSLPSRVRADGRLVESAKKAEAAQQTLGNKVDSLSQAASERKARALEAADEAKQRALEAAEEAKQRSRETADSLQERAAEAIDHGKAYVGGLQDQVGQGTQQIWGDAMGKVAKTKLWFVESLQGLRDALREALLGAAVALDNRAKDAREGARQEHWAKLKARYGLPDHAPTMEFSEELREHEERLARLHRARELAESVDDQVSVVRTDHLSEREYARHRRQLKRLLEKERREKALLDGEQLSYGEPEE
jgi:gas vesicle protein